MGGLHHVQRARHVDLIALQRLVHRHGHAAHRGEVNDLIHPLHRIGAVSSRTDVALDKLQTSGRLVAHDAAHDLQIARRAGEVVVHHSHALAEGEELFDYVGTNESSSTGDKPGTWRRTKGVLDLRVSHGRGD